MLVACAIGVGACWLRSVQGASEFIITDVKGHATLGTTLAFLNVFRSNLSYGRYWDGRGQLGFLVRSGRELMRTIVTYTRIPETKEEDNELAEQAKEVLRLTNCLHHSIVLAIQNYDDHPPFDPPYDIKEKLVTPGWLRQQEEAALEKAEAAGDRPEPDNKGRPALIATMLSAKIYWMYHRGWMSSAVLKKCDHHINEYVGAWMACEKICGTPMVFPYTQMLNIFLVLFVFTFPIPLAHVFWNEHSPINGYIITGFIATCARFLRCPALWAESLTWAALCVCRSLVAYAFFGMNAVGVEIENPFGDDANDLPVDKMMNRVHLDTQSLLDLRLCSPQAEDAVELRARKATEEAELQKATSKAGARGGRAPRTSSRLPG